MKISAEQTTDGTSLSRTAINYKLSEDELKSEYLKEKPRITKAIMKAYYIFGEK